MTISSSPEPIAAVPVVVPAAPVPKASGKAFSSSLQSTKAVPTESDEGEATTAYATPSQPSVTVTANTSSGSVDPDEARSTKIEVTPPKVEVTTQSEVVSSPASPAPVIINTTGPVYVTNDYGDAAPVSTSAPAAPAVETVPASVSQPKLEDFPPQVQAQITRIKAGIPPILHHLSSGQSGTDSGLASAMETAYANHAEKLSAMRSAPSNAMDAVSGLQAQQLELLHEIARMLSESALLTPSSDASAPAAPVASAAPNSSAPATAAAPRKLTLDEISQLPLGEFMKYSQANISAAIGGATSSPAAGSDPVAPQAPATAPTAGGDNMQSARGDLIGMLKQLLPMLKALITSLRAEMEKETPPSPSEKFAEMLVQLKALAAEFMNATPGANGADRANASDSSSSIKDQMTHNLMTGILAKVTQMLEKFAEAAAKSPGSAAPVTTPAAAAPAAVEPAPVQGADSKADSSPTSDENQAMIEKLMTMLILLLVQMLQSLFGEFNNSSSYQA